MAKIVYISEDMALDCLTAQIPYFLCRIQFSVLSQINLNYKISQSGSLRLHVRVNCSFFFFFL